MTRQTIERFDVFISEPGKRYELLNEAESMLPQAARVQKSAGILVTRHDPTGYELSDMVPLGEAGQQAGRNQSRKYTTALPGGNHGQPQ